jgi:hypothetical protein
MVDKLKQLAPASAMLLLDAAMNFSDYHNTQLSIGLAVAAMLLLMIPAWDHLVPLVKPRNFNSVRGLWFLPTALLVGGSLLVTVLVYLSPIPPTTTSLGWLLIFVAIATVFGALWVGAAWAYSVLISPVPISRSSELIPTQDVAPSIDEDLLPLTEFLRQAEQRGWHFTEPPNTSQAAEICDRLREEARNGKITFYGVEKLWDSDAVMRRQSREKIPDAHWKEFEIECLSCFRLNRRDGSILGVSGDNWPTRTYTNIVSVKAAYYVNLHLLRRQAERWLTDVTKRGTSKTVPLKEAATRAYEQGGLMAKAAERDHTPEETLIYLCYALCDRLTVFGNKAPSRMPQPVPVRRIGGSRYDFAAENDEIVARERTGKGVYRGLYVLDDELVRALREIKAIGSEIED